MAVQAEHTGVATTALQHPVDVGTLDEVVVITAAPPDESNDTKPSTWNDAPPWLSYGDL
jgi:hypothetical protein